MGALKVLIWGTFLAVFILAPAVYAAEEAGVSPAVPRFQFSSEAVDPVIEYTLIHHMLAEQDPQPLVRVYGDGRVHVHIPAYMKRAGDYELRLNKAALDALVLSLAEDGIIDFSPAAVRQQKQQFESQQRASHGTLFHVSDVTETVIQIRLDEYQSGPGAGRIKNLKRRFSWNNLEHDARRFRQLAAIQRAASGAGRLHGFLSNPGLRRLE